MRQLPEDQSGSYSNPEILLQAIALLIMDARQASADVETHLQASHMVLEKQLAIASISDNVSSTLSELVIKTQAGMQDLNMTVAEIKDNLWMNTYNSWTTGTWIWFQEAMLHVLQGSCRLPGGTGFEHDMTLAYWSS